MQTSERGVIALIGHEGIVPGPYFDSVGVLTAFVGHTRAAGAPDPATLPRGMPPDLNAAIAQALTVFRKDLVAYEAEVRRAITVPVAAHEFDAAVSFHFNTGAIGWAEWVKRLNAGDDRAGAAAAIMNWSQPPEIIDRRKAEQRLFETGYYPETAINVWQVSPDARVIWTPARTLSPVAALALMGAAPAAPERPILRLGDQGAVVAELQAALNAAGLNAGEADGIFGPATRAAVRRAQVANDLMVDGIAGPATWGALLNTKDIQ